MNPILVLFGAFAVPALLGALYLTRRQIREMNNDEKKINGVKKEDNSVELHQSENV